MELSGVFAGGWGGPGDLLEQDGAFFPPHAAADGAFGAPVLTEAEFTELFGSHDDAWLDGLGDGASEVPAAPQQAPPPPAPTPPPPETDAAASARQARQARQAKLRQKTVAGTAAAVAAAPTTQPAPSSSTWQPLPETHPAFSARPAFGAGASSGGGAAPSAAAPAAAAAPAGGAARVAADGAEVLAARVAALEKEARSASLRLHFLVSQNSTLTLKLEASEARATSLDRENARLRDRWESRQVYMDEGAGI